MDVSNAIFNRIHELRVKYDLIKSIEASQRMGDKISRKEHKLLHSKPLVIARLDELVKLCQLLYPTLTLTEDLDFAQTPYEDNSESESENSYVQTQFGEVILILLRFASPSHERPNASFERMLPLVRCLPFNYRADKAMDQLIESDLDLILDLVSRLEDFIFVEEVEEAAVEFHQRAKLSFVDDPSLMTEKLKKIISKLDDHFSYEKIISRLDKFGLGDDTRQMIISTLDDYFTSETEKLKVNVSTKVEVEVERHGQLKASGMKETDFKKQAEVEETFAHAHIETYTDVASERDDHDEGPR